MGRRIVGLTSLGLNGLITFYMIVWVLFMIMYMLYTYNITNLILPVSIIDRYISFTSIRISAMSVALIPGIFTVIYVQFNKQTGFTFFTSFILSLLSLGNKSFFFYKK